MINSTLGQIVYALHLQQQHAACGVMCLKRIYMDWTFYTTCMHFYSTISNILISEICGIQWNFSICRRFDIVGTIFVHSTRFCQLCGNQLQNCALNHKQVCAHFFMLLLLLLILLILRSYNLAWTFSKQAITRNTWRALRRHIRNDTVGVWIDVTTVCTGPSSRKTPNNTIVWCPQRDIRHTNKHSHRTHIELCRVLLFMPLPSVHTANDVLCTRWQRGRTRTRKREVCSCVFLWNTRATSQVPPDSLFRLSTRCSSSTTTCLHAGHVYLWCRTSLV